MTKLNALYSKDVLRHAATISRTERLAKPDITLSHTAPLCGSRITIDLKVDADGNITDYAQDIHACALGQAAASIVAKNIVGQPAASLADVADQMRAMLLDGADAPDGNWAEMVALEAVHTYAPRHGAVMLALETTLDALAELTGSDTGRDRMLTRRS